MPTAWMKGRGYTFYEINKHLSVRHPPPLRPPTCVSIPPSPCGPDMLNRVDNKLGTLCFQHTHCLSMYELHASKFKRICGLLYIFACVRVSCASKVFVLGQNKHRFCKVRWRSLTLHVNRYQTSALCVNMWSYARFGVLLMASQTSQNMRELRAQTCAHKFSERDREPRVMHAHKTKTRAILHINA